MNKSYQIIGSIFFILIIGLLGLYTSDIEQKNPESLFLTAQDRERYQNFQDKISSKNFLVMKVKIERPIQTHDRYLEIDHQIRNKIKNTCDECNIISLKDQYKTNEQLKRSFERPINQHLVNFIGSDYVAFFVFNNNEDQLKKFISQTLNNELFKGIDTNLAGHSYTNYLLDQYSESIQTQLFPIMFLAAFFLLLFITKSAIGSFVIFISSIMASLIGLSGIKLFFIDMNMITSIMPLLLFAINLSLGLHLYYSYLKFNDVWAAINYKISPITLMITTTAIGFGSLILSDIQVIKQFGILSSFLILLTCITSCLWFLSNDFLLSKIKQRINLNHYLSDLFQQSLSKYLILMISAIAIAVGSLVIPQLKINTDATTFFPKHAKVKESIQDITKTVIGMPIVEIIISRDDAEALSAYETYNALEEELNNQNFSQSYKIISAVQLLKHANQLYTGQLELPAHILAIQALTTQLPQQLRENYLLEQDYRITLSGDALNSDKYFEDIEVLKKVLSKHNIHMYEIGGLYHGLMKSQSALIAILAKSFLIGLLIISILALIFLRELKVFFIFIIVNIVPLCITLGILYFSGITIDIATVMTFSIALGLIVDSSFHLIHSYQMSKELSFHDYMETTVRPIILSSLIFIFCFMLFTTNAFLPIRQFGLNLAIMIALGMIFDLFILPTLYLKRTDIREVFDE